MRVFLACSELHFGKYNEASSVETVARLRLRKTGPTRDS